MPGERIVINHADAGTRHQEHFPVDLSQPLVLDVHNPHGDVTIRATDRGDVLVGHSAPELPGGEAGLLIDVQENRIEIRPHPHIGAGWSGSIAGIDLDAVAEQITRAFRWAGPSSSFGPGAMRAASGSRGWTAIAIDVPRTVAGRITIHTASGNVRVEGVAGELALNAMSGDVRVVGAGGNLVLHTASGDMTVEGATGRLSARSASGDVRISSAQVEGCQVQTASGDIVLDAVLNGEGPFRAQTASGDVRLTLRQSAAGGDEPGATLDFHTVSGDAHVTPPFRQTDRRLWRAGSGERGPRVEVTTVSGDLTAGFADAERLVASASSPVSPMDDAPLAPAGAPVPPSSPTAPPPPPQNWPHGQLDLAATEARPDAEPTTHGDAARLAVLEAVERGEIDIEEALLRLDAADATTGS